MDLVRIVRSYILKCLKQCGQSGSCIKVLVMDSETVGMISIAFLQSELVNKEIFLFESIENRSQEKLTYLSCICFIRPTEANVLRLCNELQNPRYATYSIFFSNIIDRSLIRQLAEADRYELVNEVQEYYVDYFAMDNDLFSVGVDVCCKGDFEWDENALERCAQALISLMLSTRKYPMIRYQGTSRLCKELAEKLSSKMCREASLFNFKSNEASLLLIVDRREDAVTPMLNQWTYQAMLHEVIGMRRNRIDTSEFLSNASSSSTTAAAIDEPSEIILNIENDEFYSVNRHLNYGQIGINIKRLLEIYQEKHKTQSKLETIADMKLFIETYPEFKKLSNTVTKHIRLISELVMHVQTFRLMEISELEQKIVCNGDSNEIFQKMKEFINAVDIVRDIDVVRMVALYMLRFEGTSKTTKEIKQIFNMLEKRKLNTKWMKFLRLLYKYGGLGFRHSDLFNNQSPLSFSRQLIKGIMGVENVYGQHRPFIIDLIDQVIKGKLKESLYPFVHERPPPALLLDQKLNDLVVFYVGGVTYEESYEARKASRMSNEHNNHMDIILGGTQVHNFRSYVDEVLAAASNSNEIPLLIA